jgi:hypothetical protein
MHRRDISVALFASAAGSALLSERSEAQSCTAPCYAQTSAESAAGVTPTNTAYPPGNVLRYGADPNGSADSTAAFNAATFATLSYSLNGLLNEIVVPAGRYLINGTVYVRKGQKLRGALGGTYIVCNNSGSGPTFKLGWGLISGTPTQDSGGQPLSIESLFLLGGPASGCIDCSGVAGGCIKDLFISAPALGINISGSGDLNCTNIIFDQGSVGINITNASNCQFDTLKFYNLHYDLQIGSTVYDCQWTNCHCEYNQYTSILFGDSATAIYNLKFTDWIFTYNVQYATYSGAIQNRAAGVVARFDSCTFNNMPGYAYLHGTQIGSQLDFSACTFDGRKSAAAYTQSTTAAAIDTLNETVTLTGCTFRNLPAQPILFGGTLQSILELSGGNYSGNSGASFIGISNSAGTSLVRVSGLRGDATQTLVNNQSTVTVVIQNCLGWFGPIATSGSKRYVLIPYQFSNVYQITLRANINVGGNADYRKATVLLVEKDNDYSSGAKSFITASVPIQGAANLNGVIAVAAEFGSVGGGTAISMADSGSLSISWPSTYTYESIDVQML